MMGCQVNPGACETIQVGRVLFAYRDIFTVVDEFYTRIQNDPLLQVPFRSVHDWPEHIQRLTHFWWIRFGGRPYRDDMYNPVLKHFEAGFNAEFLARWLLLFHQTLDTHLTTEQAQLWKSVSESMGEALSIKNELYKSGR